MQVFWVLLVASAFAIANCEDGDNSAALLDPKDMEVANVFVIVTCDDDDSAALLDPKDMDAIQEKLAKMEFLEQILGAIFGFKKPDARDDTCLPIGAECHFWSGPNCCGLRTRCIVWDTQLTAAYKGGPARWLSKCREYRLGVWLDDIGSWFSSWGK